MSKCFECEYDGGLLEDLCSLYKERNEFLDRIAKLSNQLSIKKNAALNVRSIYLPIVEDLRKCIMDNNGSGINYSHDELMNRVMAAVAYFESYVKFGEDYE